MSYAYNYVPEARLLYVYAKGDCTLEDAIDLWERQSTDTEIPREYDELVDLSRATSVAGTIQTYEVVRDTVERILTRTPQRLAIVATRPEIWEVGKLWESECDLIGRQCIVFHDLRTACIWLGADEILVDRVKSLAG